MHVLFSAVGIAVVLGTVTSCASSDADSYSADGGASADGGVGDCDLALVIPAMGAINRELELAVQVIPADLAGARSFDWSIDIGGRVQNPVYLADPAERVSFVPTEAGPYQVVVQASIGPVVCTPALGTVTIVADGALSQDYRMRVVPNAGAPMQDFSVQVFGGSDSALPGTTLQSGNLMQGRVSDSLGNGVAAYLRARKRGTLVQSDYEGFSDAQGTYSLLLPDGRYDLSVYPSLDLQPTFVIEDVEATGSVMNILLPPALPIQGHLLDAAGGPIVGARIRVGIDGSQSTSILSAANGSFMVQGYYGQLQSLSVSPPADSGLPVLRSQTLSGQSIDALSDIEIQYTHTTVNTELDLSLDQGAAAPSAQVEWRAQVPDAATVKIASSEVVSGVLRVEALTDDTGHVQTRLSAIVTDLVLRSADGSQGKVLRDVPWDTVPVQAIELTPLLPIPVSVSVTQPVASLKVRATPLGVLAPQSEISEQTLAESGTTSILALQGGRYLLSASIDQAIESSSVVTVSTTMPTVSLQIPNTVLISGHLSLVGGSAAGAQVSLYCVSCTGEDATKVKAHGVSDGTGRYVLRVVDPGIVVP